MADARVRRESAAASCRSSTSDSVPGALAQVALEELEQLLAALVLVDAADVDGERAADVVLLPEARRLRVLRHLRSDADDDRRHVAGCRRRA